MKLSFSLVLANSLAFAHGAAPSLRGAEKPRTLQVATPIKVPGECSLSNFISVLGTAEALQQTLGVSTEDELKAICEGALSTNTMDLSVAVGKGPQFLKNFLDGGASWNEDSTLDADDAALIDFTYKAHGSSKVFSAPNGGADDAYPGYFSNFLNGDQECRLGAIECCYTSRRGAEVEDNSEMCALDMTLAKKSNHIKLKSWTVYDANPEDKTFCTGFAYDSGSFDDKVKYNTLFHMAMKTNLVDNGYVKEVPGAPMCGCVEQMPVVTNASCVKAHEGYVIETDNTLRVDITWTGCQIDGTKANLMDYYMSLPERTNMEKFFVKTKLVGDGQCAAAADAFLNDKFIVKKTA